MIKIIFFIVLFFPFNAFSMKPLESYLQEDKNFYYIVIRCAGINNLYGSLDQRFQELTIPNATAFIAIALQIKANSPQVVINDVKSITQDYTKIANKNRRSTGSYFKGIVASDMVVCRELKKQLD